METDPYNVEYDAEPMLGWFEYGNLPAGLIRNASSAFATLARDVVDDLPRSPERTVALRKLLEAKDAAVRCAVAELGFERMRTVGAQRTEADEPDTEPLPCCGGGGAHAPTCTEFRGS